MKKFIMIMIVMLLIVSVTGCKKDKGVKKDSGSVDVDTTVEQTTEASGTVTEDVYTNTNSLEKEDAQDFDHAEGTLVTDSTVITDLQIYIEKFYSNFLFTPKSDTGEITEMDMQLFAISFIYQYEYTDLRFDSEEFILYIPDENVAEVIKRYFDYEFTNHRYPLDSKISYEDGYYLMPARDEYFGPTPTINSVLKLSDFDYKVAFESTDENNQVSHFEAIVEEREGRFVMINYKKVVEETQTTEATTETPASN